MKGTIYIDDLGSWERRKDTLRLDADAYFDLMDELWERRVGAARRIMQLARRFGCVRFGSEGGRLWYYLHPSVRFDGWQLTSWDEYGPIGHADVKAGDFERLAESIERTIEYRTAA